MDEDGSDEENEKEQDFIGPSDAMKELLRVLEFNAIDMYRYLKLLLLFLK